MCQCDYTCLSYEECCPDYESQCTTSKTPPSSSLQRQNGAPERLTQPSNSLRLASGLVFVLCATENSCKGRCGEAFRRGRRCSCDPDCHKFKQCCSDFQTYCDAAGELRRFFPERSAASVHGFRQNQPEGEILALVCTWGEQWSIFAVLTSPQRRSVEPPVLQKQ